jgi:hypothetical protein
MSDGWLVAAGTLAASLAAAALLAQPPGSDDYTRYELLAPETAQFRIVYEVTALARTRSPC